MDGSLFGNSEDGGGDEDVPNRSPGWDTAEPALVARIGDDDVGPGHLETAEGDTCKDGDERTSHRVGDDVGAEEADDGTVEKLVDKCDVDTTETSERACLGADMLDGGAYFRGDGLLFHEEEVGFDKFGLLRVLVFGEERAVGFIGVGVFGLEGCGCGSLDHGEGGYDIAIGVGDLIAEC